MNHMLSGTLNQYRHAYDARFQKLLTRLDWCLFSPFISLEWSKTAHSNNALELAF